MLGTWSLPTDHSGLWATVLNKIALWTTESKPGSLPLLLSSPVSQACLPSLRLGLLLSWVTTYILGPQLLAAVNGRICQVVESQLENQQVNEPLCSGRLSQLRWLSSLGREKRIPGSGAEGQSDSSCLLTLPNRPLPSGWTLSVCRTHPGDCSCPKDVPPPMMVPTKQMQQGRGKGKQQKCFLFFNNGLYTSLCFSSRPTKPYILIHLS